MTARPAPSRVEPPRGGAPDLARSTLVMTAFTAVSRLTGFVRVLVVAAVLGTTFLGNVYQSANTVPNLLFEMFAAGALQAVLIPTLVDVVDRGRRHEAEHVAGSVLGLVGVVLAALVAIGMLAAPWIARALVSGVDSPEVREAQAHLGTVFLWWFLPQVLFYAAGLVASAVLNAHDRFAAPVAAPVVNNVVVTLAYAAFWWLRDGAPPSLDLSTLEIVVLAGGTTAAVVAFTAVPVLALRRTGFSLRPRFDHRHPTVRRLARLGGWAALYLAATQVLLAAVLVLGNRVEGGVVAYQVGFTFFLLPHALFTVPVVTASFPLLSRRALAGDGAAYGAVVQAGLRAILYFALPATAALAALAAPVSRALLFGAATGDGTDQVALAVAGFAPGLVGYGAFLYLTRAWYALGDSRTPALVNVALVVAGIALMVGAGLALEGTALVGALAGAHSLAYLAGTAVLFGVLRSRLGRHHVRAVARALASGVGAAALAGAVMWGLQTAVRLDGRLGAVIEVAVAGGAGLLLYLGLQALAGMRPGTVVGLLRGGEAPTGG